MPATARRLPASSIASSPKRSRRPRPDAGLRTSELRLRVERGPALEFLRQQPLDLLRPFAVGLELPGFVPAWMIIVGLAHARGERVLLFFQRLDLPRQLLEFTNFLETEFHAAGRSRRRLHRRFATLRRGAA